MAKNFSTIVVHVRPDLDEIAAIWALKRFGEEKFPGISKANAVFWSPPDGDADVTLEEIFQNEGVVAVGVGGGMFDEHPTLKRAGKDEECAFTLVCKHLGLDEDMAMEKITKFVFNSDKSPGGGQFDLSELIKCLHRRYPDSPNEVIKWATIALNAKYDEHKKFVGEIRQEFLDKAKIETVAGPQGRQLTLVTIESDSEQINKLARSEHGCKAAIVIQKKSTGNVQIFTDKSQGLTLYDVVALIRLAEQEAKGQPAPTDWKDLTRDGKAEGVLEWYYFEKGQMLLNGSLTATNVPPTNLSFEKIRELVKIGINPGYFNPAREATCRQGICDSTPENPCPLYSAGLGRCRQIRFKARKG